MNGRALCLPVISTAVPGGRAALPPILRNSIGGNLSKSSTGPYVVVLTCLAKLEQNVHLSGLALPWRFWSGFWTDFLQDNSEAKLFLRCCGCFDGI
ncbi:hypothetical protein B0H14DRAFT_2859504 [Mycena olivaceomarginata]|nr:hypothetical protein B0H14DRAFT_2859504 [Mycena olivaceomarginata]